MTDTRWITDETLTAFLDAALPQDQAQAVADAAETDPEIARRLAALDLPLDDLRAALAPEQLSAPQLPPHLLAANTPRAPKGRMLWASATMAAAFVAGFALNELVATQSPGPAKWVDAVAAYHALYVPQTLAAPRQPADQTASVLDQAQAAFDLSLTPALDIAALDFKRAQMLGWNGKPLLQIAYLTEDGTPMALCLTRVTADDRGPTSSINHALAGVSWVRDGVGFYLVGGEDLATVEAFSTRIIAQL